MACRIASEAKSSVIISGRTKPQSIPHPNIEFRPLDASSMQQIKQYANAFKQSAQQQQLDLLIMTQGIMTMAGRTETPEGIDRKMAVHYYGKQLLIRELLPALKDDAKVVIVFDGKYGNPDKLNWDDLDLKRNFSLGNAANHCMVMNDAMIQWWAAQQRQQGIHHTRHFVHAYPGGVKTGILRDLPWYLRAPAWALGSLIAVSPETCANNLLNGVSKSAAEGNDHGRFWSNIDNKGRLIGNKAIWTEEQMQRIAEHTWKLVDGR
jgi:NAD(P)-dependent dehydrogenase (short-subunit alcohol dehydrogenase family)